MDCNYEFDKDAKNIIFTIDTEVIEISYNEDVNLTNFVTKLTELIDKKTTLNDISSINDAILDEKEKIINQTIKDIISNFNETLQEDIENTI